MTEDRPTYVSFIFDEKDRLAVDTARAKLNLSRAKFIKQAALEKADDVNRS